MRLSTPTSLCLAAAAAVLLSVSTPAHAQATDPADPACTTPHNRTFPLTTRIHSGPDSYEAGGGYGTWYLDLTNTTARPCSGVHPVVVLVDEKRALSPSQPRLDFYAGTSPHPVHFERTDEDELVGAFDDGFPGFTVGPGRTVTVKVRLSVTSDAEPNKITANAAVVQRHNDDGDWVGQSNDYRFAIDAEPAAAQAQPVQPVQPVQPAASASATASPGTRLPLADELAHTGLGAAGAALAGTVVLLFTGGALLFARRRRRADTPLP